MWNSTYEDDEESSIEFLSKIEIQWEYMGKASPKKFIEKKQKNEELGECEEHKFNPHFDGIACFEAQKGELSPRKKFYYFFNNQYMVTTSLDYFTVEENIVDLYYDIVLKSIQPIKQ